MRSKSLTVLTGLKVERMTVGEVLVTLGVALLGGAGFTAIVNAINERWKYKAERKAKLEDDAKDETDQIQALNEAVEKLETMEDTKNKAIDERLDAIDVAFCSAVRVTFTGSMIPASTMFT